jgi:uncharacterized membrane protein YedE/YeeE
MTNDVVLFIYAYTLLELLLDIGAVYFAVKLARVTGAFRGWLLMIGAVVLTTLSVSSSVISLIVFFPESALESLVNQFGAGTIVEGSVFGIGTSLFLFLAMFELYRTFKRLQPKPSPAE